MFVIKFLCQALSSIIGTQSIHARQSGKVVVVLRLFLLPVQLYVLQLESFKFSSRTTVGLGYRDFPPHFTLVIWTSQIEIRDFWQYRACKISWESLCIKTFCFLVFLQKTWRSSGAISFTASSTSICHSSKKKSFFFMQRWNYLSCTNENLRRCTRMKMLPCLTHLINIHFTFFQIDQQNLVDTMTFNLCLFDIKNKKESWTQFSIMNRNNMFVIDKQLIHVSAITILLSRWQIISDNPWIHLDESRPCDEMAKRPIV